MLVVDASAALALVVSRSGFEVLADDLAAPALLWSEVTSVLGELVWRRELSPELADRGHAALLAASISRRNPGELYERARGVARRLGWAKTYDAEYVALAEMLEVPLVTRDLRLQRSAGRLVEVVTPDDVAR